MKHVVGGPGVARAGQSSPGQYPRRMGHPQDTDSQKKSRKQSTPGTGNQKRFPLPVERKKEIKGPVFRLAAAI